MKLHASILSTCVLLTASCVIAGPLDPPPGPIDSTMKTLVEVEPRTAINSINTPGDANSAFRITQPGSYYLAQNFSILGFLSDLHAIEIAASNVTIDFNGFTLTGLSGALDGVIADGANLRNIVIKNGTIQSFDTGINLDNIDLNEVIVEDMTVKNCDGLGISITNGRTSRCIVKDNGSTGINVDSNGFIETCIVENNDSDGIDAGFGSIIRDNIVRNNFNNGIRVLSRCIVRDNLVTENGTGTGNKAGIEVVGNDSLIQSNVVVANDIGLQSSTLSIFVQNIVSGNALDINISGSNPGLGDEVTSPNGAGPWDNIVP